MLTVLFGLDFLQMIEIGEQLIPLRVQFGCARPVLHLFAQDQREKT